MNFCGPGYSDDYTSIDRLGCGITMETGGKVMEHVVGVRPNAESDVVA